ncbi:hypothetical protein SCHPADRAFT_535103 [Schizopora paradoxa]|uniref:Uncharacterized protein n=1 Tax=Schizopora paradoxa TaxID=27342 RepID=A0A0H2RZ76_9AGAM|nr:hypothetical protein SCHPADRAFT_535103 [Schizopora paradoxa]
MAVISQDSEDYHLGTYITLYKVKLKFSDDVKPTETLEITKTPLGRINASLSEEEKSSSSRRQIREHEWDMEDDCDMFSKDTIIIRPSYSNLSLNSIGALLCTRRGELEIDRCEDEYQISGADIITSCYKRIREGSLNYDEESDYVVDKDRSRLTLVAKLQNFDQMDFWSMRIDSSLNNVDTIVGSRPILPDISKLEGILGPIGKVAASSAVVQKLIDAIKSFSSE